MTEKPNKKESPKALKIRKAIEAKGYTIESLKWEPLFGPFEMAGYDGGWTLIAYPRPEFSNHPRGRYGVIGGYNVDEVLEFIANHVPDLTLEATNV